VVACVAVDRVYALLSELTNGIHIHVRNPDRHEKGEWPASYSLPVTETRRGCSVRSFGSASSSTVKPRVHDTHERLRKYGEPRGTVTLPGLRSGAELLAALVNTTVVAVEYLRVGSTVWLPAESVAPGR
jgi:hypothetical protein